MHRDLLQEISGLKKAGINPDLLNIFWNYRFLAVCNKPIFTLRFLLSLKWILHFMQINAIIHEWDLVGLTGTDLEGK